MSHPQVRKIIHIDMDAFFAAIEQRDDPKLRGRPVVVGGQPDGRGVVATASYEARVFGIGSAMASARAYRLCPKAIFVKPRFEVYRQVSEQVMRILHEYSELVEPMSLDEAYVDATGNKRGFAFARDVAKEIRDRIRAETELTASAGVAPNKFLAKVASDMRKPNGLFILPPERVQGFLRTLPVRKVPGIGSVTEKKMLELGVKTVGVLSQFSLAALSSLFGKQGNWFYRVSRGEDNRAVVSERERKSVGCEDTFAEDVTDDETIRTELNKLGTRLETRLEKRMLCGQTITLKVTYSNFEKISRSVTVPEAIWKATDLIGAVNSLIPKTELGARPARLLGISVGKLADRVADENGSDTTPQLGLW